VQVKNKPCDRGSEHAFILGSMVCTVANNKMFHGASGEKAKGANYPSLIPMYQQIQKIYTEDGPMGKYC
jgi:hypothetical protein